MKELIIIGLVFVLLFGFGCVSKEIECAYLDSQLNNEFNSLSTNCSIDENCIPLMISIDCLAPCPICVQNSSEVQAIRNIENKIYELNCDVEICASECPLNQSWSCGCVNGVCQHTEPAEEQNIIIVNLDEKFWLVENQTVSIEPENFQLKLIKIIYSPCPKGAECIWSGLGAEVEVSKDNQVNQTMLSIEHPSEEFFGFKINLIEVTKTHVGFKISKI